MKYTVFYVEQGEQSKKTIKLTTQRPSSTQAFNRFKKDMGGLKGMKQKNISIKNILPA